jgi:hypothetical protein
LYIPETSTMCKGLVAGGGDSSAFPVP